jgi:hypothetical protein
MKLKCGLIFCIFFGFSSVYGDHKKDPILPVGGGHDVPIKGRFDLAHNEEYELIGKIYRRLDGRYEFEIDLTLQPWLATASRVSDPFMVIENPEFLPQFEGKTVKVNLIAHRVKNENCDDPKFFNMTVELRGIPLLYQPPVPLR